MNIEKLESVLEFVDYKFQKKDYYDSMYENTGIEFYKELPHSIGFDLLDNNYYGDCYGSVEFTFNDDDGSLSLVHLRTLNSCVVYNDGKIGFGYNLIDIGETTRFELISDIIYDTINDENFFQYNLVVGNISELQFLFKVLDNIINGKYPNITNILNIKYFPAYK